MPLLEGDIKFVRSASMANADHGGGPPTNQVIPDGSSNAMFNDFSDDDWVGGKVDVVQLFGMLDNTDTDPLLGAYVIAASPPSDDNVSLTLIRSPGTFARRPDLVDIVEATSSPGPEFAGYLLENHTASTRVVRIAQRPRAPAPTVNTTLCLVINEGLPTEERAYVRVRRVTVSTETFTVSDGAGNPVDFQMQVAVCELFDVVGVAFAGSPPSRFYSRATGKTMIRTVFFSDAGTFYSSSRLALPVTDPAAMEVKLESVYTQIVPNTASEVPILNQLSAGVRVVDLVDYLGTLQVSASAHTQRIFITEANAGSAYVFKLNPPPAPNSIAVSYVALGEWATLIDDGAGNLGSGPGSGQVLYSTGDCAVSTDVIPDYNTFLLITHADTAPYVNNCPSGPVTLLAQPPEFDLEITPGANLTGATVEWVSAGVARTAAVGVGGVLSGDATGLAVSATGRVYIRPAAMPDPGTNFTVNYQQRPTLTEPLTGASPDVGGYITVTTTEEAIPGTLSVNWTTARTVSKTSGADLSGTSSRQSSQTLALGDSIYSGARLAGVGRDVVTRTKLTNSTYSEKTESATTDKLVVAHSINDDGAGGWGHASLGSFAYAAKTGSLRVVSQGASVTSYRHDHEEALSFKGTNNIIVSMG